ncbi:MAG: hypothetical protein A2V98_02315 [Planctomycetes bacterium RBG_16_64_12]|nr:MAG: hypothetical protein A2V98_02315 [Planctomycetes bacterium RBG_16_64_12]
MLYKTASAAVFTLMLVSLFAATGCSTLATGPQLGILSYPIPVSPYFQDELEDQFWDKERYATVPILGPITEGGPAVALDPPSQDEIIRALEEARPLEGGLALLHETQRNNVRIVVEPLDDSVDPPRVYPLIGPAQLHHAHYKCTIYFTEITRVGWPVPYTTRNEDAQEVIYIDHNHFHMVGNIDAGPGSEY